MLAAFLLLAALLFVLLRPEPEPTVEPRPVVWSIEPDRLWAVTITLPEQEKRERWVKEGDDWYFDQSDHRRVDPARWGAGIPLLLSGPKAERLIARDAGAEALAGYGLNSPSMQVELAMADGTSLVVDVGDSTPDGNADYVKLRGSADIYSVSREWRDVLKELVLNPPYAE
jgi:hypothetical protein